jgi:acyl-CoA thioester hydrolase
VTRESPALSLPDPRTPVFETFVRVRFHEVDALGHVNNAAYLNYLEQAAIDHATALGLDWERLQELGGVFIARHHDITFRRPAFAGDVLRIVTWLGEPRGARVERSYRVFREPAPVATAIVFGRIVDATQVLDSTDLVAEATTEWVFVGTHSRPRRIPPDVVAMFRQGGERAPTRGQDSDRGS